MQVKLVFQSGARSGEDIPVENFPFYIGRAADCGLRLDQDLVADKHCRPDDPGRSDQGGGSRFSARDRGEPPTGDHH